MREWIKTTDSLPLKPGRGSYEHVSCWIVVNGRVEEGLWNCEHECWDDSEGDDWRYDPTTPTHWMVNERPSPPEAAQ